MKTNRSPRVGVGEEGVAVRGGGEGPQLVEEAVHGGAARPSVEPQQKRSGGRVLVCFHEPKTIDKKII